MFTSLCIVFAVSFCVSTLVCWFVKRWANTVGLIDKPGERKIHQTPVPTAGGLGIWLGILLPVTVVTGLLLLCQQSDAVKNLLPESIAQYIDGAFYRSGQLWLLIGLGSVLVLLGILDDKYNLNWKLRICVQFLLATAAVCAGWRFTIFLDLPIFTAVLSVFWIVGLVNAFNMLDNMNGLSAGVALVCTLFLATVMFLSPNAESREPQYFIAALLLMLAGAIAGFMVHNNPWRGSLFMGDCGAYFIGFLLATLTLTATFATYQGDGESTGGRQTIFVPLMILAVPLYDMMTVILIRLRHGKSPFVGDKNHFSHRLVDLGLSKPYAVLTIYLTTMICGIGALLLYCVPFYGAVLLFTQTVLTLLLIAVIEHTGRKRE